MARYTGPKCRLCRREGVKLYLKGARCESEKCAVSKRRQSPGQHGTARKRPSSYGLQLREKQKAKRIYGVLEKQFKNYVKTALKRKGVTGEVLMQMLETRLDSIVYRAGFASSRAQARQFIRSNYFSVNGSNVTIPSFRVNGGDTVKVEKQDKVSVREVLKMPGWLNTDKKQLQAEVVGLPTMEQVQQVESGINPQLIVEFYSR